MSQISTRPIRVPARIDAPEIIDLEAVLALRNAHARHVHGSTAYDMTLPQVFAAWHDQVDHPVSGLLAERGGRIIGIAGVDIVPGDDARTAGVNVRVETDERQQGVGRRLLAEAEDLARGLGRSVLQAWTEHRPSEHPPHAAATGFGTVPLDASAAFAVAHGYRLEQVYRNSTLTLSPALHERVERLGDDARASAGDDYRYESWLGPTDSANAEPLAQLKSRMATDAPSGDVEVEDGVWDAARLARAETQDAAGGVRRLIGVVRHLPTGALVALNELNLGPADPTLANQNDTLVRAEHRGHRLGMWVKCATLRRLHELFPDVRHVETYNAEENRPMLAINEAMGFVPTLYAGVWQKEVRADAGSTGNSDSSGS